MPALINSFYQAENPLINPPALPYDAPPLHLVKIEHMMPATDYAIARTVDNLAAISDIPREEADFANVVEALERADHELDYVTTVINQMVNTTGDKAQKKLMEEIEGKLSAFTTGRWQDDALFARVKAVHDSAASLTPEQTILLDKIYNNFVRNGALLPAAEKQRLREINEQLARLGTKFKDNVSAAKGAYKRYVDDPNELAGVPERALKKYKDNAAKDGQPGRFLIQLEPAPTDIMTHCENAALRQEMFHASGKLCQGGPFDNAADMMTVMNLRHEHALLLGYPNHAAFVLSDRMAADPQTVTAFLERNLAAYKPEAEKELEEIKAYALRTDGITDLQPWDVDYYGRRLKEETFSMKTESLRPYFRLENVVAGISKHAEKLFDIEMRKETTGKYPVHHGGVSVYEVFDKKAQQVRGVIYMDYFANPGIKKGGAWHQSLRTYAVGPDGKAEIPITTNTCNFTEPPQGEPALLSPSEVKTVFHEFGHALHCLLGEGQYRLLTGTRVKRDFVELMSQLMEHWAFEKDVLATYAFNEKGKVIPDDMVKILQDMENFDVARTSLRQTYLGLLDMAWHTTDPATIGSVKELEQTVADRAALFPHTGNLISPTFSHIVAMDYDANYFSYKRTEAMAADVFTTFDPALGHDLYDPDARLRLRDTLYSKGATVPPMDLYTGMMGRGPDEDALLRLEGIPVPANDNKKATPQTPPLSGPAFG